MAFKVTSQKGWIKGIVAVSNRFSVPKGAILQATNMLLGERGALQTCDGTLITSAIPGGNGPILELGVYENSSFSATLIALVLTGGGAFASLYNIGTNPATLITSGSLTAGWRNPQFFMFAGKGILTLGNQTTPQVFDGTILTPVTTTSGWQANTLYQIGDKIVTSNGTFAVIATTLSFQVTSGANTQGSSSSSPISGAGFSGATAPNFAGVTTIGQGIDDNQLKWQYISTSGSLGAQTAPIGAAHGIIYAGALWVWNTSPTNSGIDGPSVLRQSTVNNPNSWPNVNMAYVGKDDGSFGRGIASFTIAEAGISPTGSLVLFKDFTTYQVTGVFGASNFAIQQVKSDMGCIASRTPLFATGFGIIRLTHLGVALFDGVNDTLISEEIRPYLFGRADITGIDWANAENARSALVVNPPMYVMAVPVAGQSGILTRLLCYDLLMKAWMIVDVTGIQGYRAIKQLRVTGTGPVTTYVGDGTLIGGQTAYNVRRWQSGDTSFDGTPIPWSFTPPEVGDPGSRAFFRRTVVRGHALTAGTMKMAASLGASAPPSDTRTVAPAGPNSSGINPPNLVGQASYEGDQDLAVAFDVAQTAPSARAQFSGTGKVTVEGVDWHLTIKPPRPMGQAV